MTEYTPEEIQAATSEEGIHTNQVIINALQNRNLALNIETRRARGRVAELEAQIAAMESHEAQPDVGPENPDESDE